MNIPQDAQKGRPARPQRAKRRRRTLRYVEPLSAARTTLADFFSILLIIGFSAESRQLILLQLIGDAFGVAGEFHVALSLNGPSLSGAGRLDGAFPIGHLCAARGREFLLGHERDEFE